MLYSALEPLCVGEYFPSWQLQPLIVRASRETYKNLAYSDHRRSIHFSLFDWDVTRFHTTSWSPGTISSLKSTDIERPYLGAWNPLVTLIIKIPSVSLVQIFLSVHLVQFEKERIRSEKDSNKA